METLTSKTISREIAKCVSRDYYSLCVIFNTQNEARLYSERLISEMKPFQDVWRNFENARFRNTLHEASTIEFPNGSRILFRGIPTEAFRGYRFHKILIDDNVPLPNNDPRMTMLRAMETLNYHEQERQIRRNAANWVF